MIEDKPGVLADITRILASHHISIEAIIQKEAAADEKHLPVILLAQQVLERELNCVIAAIEALAQHQQAGQAGTDGDVGVAM